MEETTSPVKSSTTSTFYTQPQIQATGFLTQGYGSSDNDEYDSRDRPPLSQNDRKKMERRL